MSEPTPFPSNTELNGRFPYAALPHSSMSKRNDIWAHEFHARELKLRAVAAVGICDWATAMQCLQRAELHQRA